MLPLTSTGPGAYRLFAAVAGGRRATATGVSRELARHAGAHPSHVERVALAVWRRLSASASAAAQGAGAGPNATRRVIWSTRRPMDQFSRLVVHSNIPVMLQGASCDTIPEPMNDRAEALVRISACADSSAVADAVAGSMQLDLQATDTGLTLTALGGDPSCRAEAAVQLWLPFSCGKRNLSPLDSTQPCIASVACPRPHLTSNGHLHTSSLCSVAWIPRKASSNESWPSLGHA